MEGNDLTRFSHPAAVPAELMPKDEPVPDYPNPSSSTPLHKSIPDSWPEVRRFRSLCQSLCKVEAENASVTFQGSQRYVTEAVYSVLNEFMFQVEQGLMNGELGTGQRLDRMTEKVKQKKDHLQNIKKQFEIEEKEWEELLLQHQQTIKDAEGTPEAMKKMRAAAAEATKQVQDHSCVNELAETYQKAHRALELQADGLACMVNGVEELVSRAEKIGSTLVEELHNDVFQELPHINSPEHLIKSLTAAH